MLGTIAHVEVKERQDKKLPTENGQLACLVAKRDGVIVGFDCGSGTIAVNVGQTVKKGEILVNGVFESKYGVYLQNAYGRVRARTHHTFELTIPKTEQVIVGYERIEIKKEIIFLGKSIKVFTKGGNLPTSCDTIKEEIIQLSLTDDLLLPIYQKTVYAEIPITENVTYTEEQARRIAAERIQMQVDEIQDLLMLSDHVAFWETEDGYTMTRELTCIEDIAEVVPIITN
jgi:similar to stage IV sporulation protein